MPRRNYLVGGEIEPRLSHFSLRPRGRPWWNCSPRPSARFALGRIALKIALRDLPSGGRILVPAFVCDSVLNGVRAAGLVPSFYPVDRQLVPDLETIAAGVNAGAAGVVVIHYFGFLQPPAVLEAVRALSGLVVEDLTHSFLSRPANGYLAQGSAFAFWSLRKLLPVPDGAVLLLPDAARPAQYAPGGLAATKYRRHWRHRLFWSVVRGLNIGLGAPYSDKRLLDTLLQARELRGGPVSCASMSPATNLLLNLMDYDRVAARRRENYLYLRQLLGEIPTTAFLFPELPEGICPMFLSLLVQERESLREFLATRHIVAGNQWPLPQGIPRNRLGHARDISRRIVNLPVDQRYGQRDMNLVASAVLEWWERQRTQPA